jgi:uncharacterized protein YkwD
MKKNVKFLFFFLVLCLLFKDPLTTKAKTEYRVQQGDTMWKISLKHNITLRNLLAENLQVDNPDLIYPGEIIFLPIIQRDSESEKIVLLQLINSQRIKAGLRPYELDQTLSRIAEKKSIDMKEKQYIAHKSPTYGNPTEMIRSFHIPVRSVKENIGVGEGSAREIFNTWMSSQLHQENVLQKRATHIGIGYAKGGLHGHYWTILIIEKEKE